MSVCMCVCRDSAASVIMRKEQALQGEKKATIINCHIGQADTCAR